MNPIETILINFAKQQLISNPTFIVNIIKEILTKNNVDPNVITLVDDLAAQLLPLVAQAIK